MDAPDNPSTDDQISDRQARVDAAREQWIAKLIDLSRNNRLLYFRALQLGSLELTDCDDDELDGLLHGKRLSLSALVDDDALSKAASKLQEIRRKALTNLEEKGLETLFLAVGMATWSPSDSGRPADAPVLLLPMEVEGKARESRTMTLRRSGEAQLNPILLHVLESEMRAPVDPQAILSVADADPENTRLNPEVVFVRLKQAAMRVPGFDITRRVILSNFSFQKMAMVRDLRENAAALADHDLIAAFAGDENARTLVLGAMCDSDPRELDKTPADEEFLVLDADSSQQRVIQCVRTSQDGVIQGPPGTGKSQTIANLIAALAADGKRVLFVAEKRAALEVVLQRLEALGLGHLALDLHGAETSRRQVMRKIAESLDIVRNSTPVQVEEAHRKFEQRRQLLNAQTESLHMARPPSGMSVFQMQGELLGLPAASESDLRWSASVLAPINAVNQDEIRDILAELAGGLRELFLRSASSPWTGADIGTGSQAHEALDTARQITHASWPAAKAALDSFVSETGAMPVMSLTAAGDAIELAGKVAQLLTRYRRDLFSIATTSLVDALAPAEGRIKGTVARAFSSRYRKARKEMMSKLETKHVGSKVLLQDARHALELRAAWAGLTNDANELPTTVDIANVEATLQKLQSELATLDRVLVTPTRNAPLPQLGDLLARLLREEATLFKLPRLYELEMRLQELGLASLIDHLRLQKPPPDLWPSIFSYAYFTSLLELARRDDPSIASFDGRLHDQHVEDFKSLDQLRLDLAVSRVRRRHAELAVSVRSRQRHQDAIVGREALKKSRHLPLRKVFEAAPDVLTALRPCWMASPLTVSQLLGPQRAFDVVIFDEASQVLPYDAIPSIMRGQRTVVAGDQKQLPPSTFFFYAGEEDETSEEAQAVGGFESVLDVMSSFMEPWTLDWHYRSKAESLIAFSNRHMYADRLVTFPSPSRIPPAVSHELIEGTLDDGQEDSVDAEVRRVVDLIIHHAERTVAVERDQQHSLGVITMGIKHARRIELTLDETLRSRPDLDPFFDLSNEERFFIKNLERVQGDERDDIILSIGYGKDRSGRLPYRFGPLLMEGGERRLNVAITRARRKLTLVSSFSHTDMDPGRSSRRGVELLRLYLQYAASAGTLVGETSRSPVPLNNFEADIMSALERRGLKLLPQWGASRYRIDLVVAHPNEPGRFVLAIECDGATYHSAPTARDRDRLRQQHLEALGWRFHRIWSTDWFLRRDQEVDRAVRAYEEAVAVADSRSAIQTSRLQEDEAEASKQVPNASARRPPIPRGLPIDGYTDAQLRSL